MKRILHTMAVLFGLLLAPLAAFAAVAPVAVDGAVTVSVEDAVELFDEGVVFVDVRKQSDYDAGRVPGAIHLDIKSNYTEETLSEHVEKDQAVVIYCNGHSCERSANATKKAVGWGFTKVYYMRDGYPAWEVSDFPVE